MNLLAAKQENLITVITIMVHRFSCLSLKNLQFFVPKLILR